MQKYSDEQKALESRTVEIETGLKEAKVSSVLIGRFIKQSFRAIAVLCPHDQSKRRQKQ